MGVVGFLVIAIVVFLSLRFLRKVQDSKINESNTEPFIKQKSKSNKNIKSTSSINSIEKLFSLNGRLSRKQFIKTFLLASLAGFIFGFGHGYFRGELSTFFAIPMYASIIVNWAAIIKRYHDINLSGWMVIIQVIVHNIVSTPANPYFLSIIVDALFVLPLWFMKGTVGDNKYGTDPLAKKN